MRKLFAICLNAFILLSGVAFAQGENAQSLTIDSVATAQAPWKAGEVIADAVSCSMEEEDYQCYRVFLGVTRERYKVFQDFYSENKAKATDPFLAQSDITWEDLKRSGSDMPSFGIFHGKLVNWYPSGAKNSESVMSEGGSYEVTMWYENGGKMLYMRFVDGGLLDIMAWDEEGKLIEE